MAVDYRPGDLSVDNLRSGHRPAERSGAPASAAPVPRGPADYRRRLRRWGPLAALVVPVVIGLVAGALFTMVPCAGASACIARKGPGYGLGALAVPTAVFVGLPWRTGALRIALALVTSLAVWLAVGAWASRRATRLPVADWREWRREYAWLFVALSAGVLIGVGGIALMV